MNEQLQQVLGLDELDMVEPEWGMIVPYSLSTKECATGTCAVTSTEFNVFSDLPSFQLNASNQQWRKAQEIRARHGQLSPIVIRQLV